MGEWESGIKPKVKVRITMKGAGPHTLEDVISSLKKVGRVKGRYGNSPVPYIRETDSIRALRELDSLGLVEIV